MGIEKIIKLAVSLALIALVTGELPRLTRLVQMAQLRLLAEPTNKSWGKLIILK
jgi:hypothetical protein